MKTIQTANHGGLSRRKFMVTGGAVAAVFSIVPRHVLGGAGFTGGGAGSGGMGGVGLIG